MEFELTFQNRERILEIETKEEGASCYASPTLSRHNITTARGEAKFSKQQFPLARSVQTTDLVVGAQHEGNMNSSGLLLPHRLSKT